MALIYAAAVLIVVIELVLRDFEDAGLIVGIGIALTVAIALAERAGKVILFIALVGVFALTPRIVRLIEDGDGFAWACIVVLAGLVSWVLARGAGLV